MEKQLASQSLHSQVIPSDVELPATIEAMQALSQSLHSQVIPSDKSTDLFLKSE